MQLADSSSYICQWNGVERNLRKRALQSCESVTWAQSSPFTRPSIPTFFLAGPGRVDFSRDFFEVAPNQAAPPPVASRWITGKHGLHLLPPHLQPSRLLVRSKRKSFSTATNASSQTLNKQSEETQLPGSSALQLHVT